MGAKCRMRDGTGSIPDKNCIIGDRKEHYKPFLFAKSGMIFFI